MRRKRSEDCAGGEFTLGRGSEEQELRQDDEGDGSPPAGATARFAGQDLRTVLAVITAPHDCLSRRMKTEKRTCMAGYGHAHKVSVQSCLLPLFSPALATVRGPGHTTAVGESNALIRPERDSPCTYMCVDICQYMLQWQRAAASAFHRSPGAGEECFWMCVLRVVIDSKFVCLHEVTFHTCQSYEARKPTEMPSVAGQFTAARAEPDPITVAAGISVHLCVLIYE